MRIHERADRPSTRMRASRQALASGNPSGRPRQQNQQDPINYWSLRRSGLLAIFNFCISYHTRHKGSRNSSRATTRTKSAHTHTSFDPSVTLLKTGALAKERKVGKRGITRALDHHDGQVDAVRYTRQPWHRPKTRPSTDIRHSIAIINSDKVRFFADLPARSNEVD